MKRFNNVYTITMPSTCGNEIASDDLMKEMIELIGKRMVTLFGGVTATSSQGLWKNDQGEIVQEEVLVFKSFSDNDFALGEMRVLAYEVKDAMQQECVMISMNNEAFFI